MDHDKNNRAPLNIIESELNRTIIEEERLEWIVRGQAGNMDTNLSDLISMFPALPKAGFIYTWLEVNTCR